jgi:hypothetical protein
VARAVIVVKGKGQFLEMGKEIPPHIRFDIGAYGMTPIGHKIRKGGTEDIETHHKAHHDEEKAVQIRGEQFFYRVFSHHGKEHVGRRDQRSAEHIRGEEYPVGAVVGGEYGKYGPVEILFIMHVS